MAKKKYNDKSNKFADWSTKKLKQEAKGYHEIIYKVECYGVRDMMNFDGIMNELARRGIFPKNELEF